MTKRVQRLCVMVMSNLCHTHCIASSPPLKTNQEPDAIGQRAQFSRNLRV
jgi:hypothetical protein